MGPLLALVGALVTGPIACEVLRVKDGDTIRLRCHVWPDATQTTDLRLRGADAPEVNGKCEAERQRALAAKAFVTLWVGSHVQIYSVAHDLYGGRHVGLVRRADGAWLHEALVSEGLARPYDGKSRRKGWCDGQSLGETAGGGAG